MKRNTKEEILMESLRLFAYSGYSGVTMRDIAEKVGIRQSSLYKHFTGKQEIFDSIVERMDAEYWYMTIAISVLNNISKKL